ncbi:MAG: hypothetical protein KAS92_01695 [Candidatus Omnitrophica bacterium]|nr:hypothetical protein [Candidatus Omnitrophota bacterium]
MNVILRITIIGGILCLTSGVHAYSGRDQIVDQALDRVEGNLGQQRVHKDIALTYPEAEISSQDHGEISIPPKVVSSPRISGRSMKTSTYEQDKSLSMNFEFGTEMFYHKFKEPGYMEQDGFLYGLQAAYTLRTSFNKDTLGLSDHFSEHRNKLNVFRFEGMLAFGSVDFDSDDVGTYTVRDNFMYDVRGLAGYDFLPAKGLILTPYIGIAYRYLRDDSPGRILPFASFSGAFDFKRESTYLYMPFGLTTTKEYDRGWVVDLTVEYDLLLNGEQNNHYNDGGYKVRDSLGQLYIIDAMEFDQDKGYGFRTSARFTNENGDICYFIEPYFRYWKIRDSETLQFTSNSGSVRWVDSTGTIPRTGQQPKNETTEAGIKLGLRY